MVYISYHAAWIDSADSEFTLVCYVHSHFTETHNELDQPAYDVYTEDNAFCYQVKAISYTHHSNSSTIWILGSIYFPPTVWGDGVATSRES